MYTHMYVCVYSFIYLTNIYWLSTMYQALFPEPMELLLLVGETAYIVDK